MIVKGRGDILGFVHDLVDTSSRSGGGGGTVAASGVCGDESLAGARGEGGVAERRYGGRWFRSPDLGVLVLRVVGTGGVGVTVEFPEGASGVKGIVATGRLFSGILAVRTYANALAHSPFVGGSGRALLLVLVVGVATTTPAATGELGVASGAERHVVAELVATVALAEDGAWIKAARFTKSPEHPQRAFDKEGGPLVVGVEHRDEDRVLGSPFGVFKEPVGGMDEGHAPQVVVAEDLALEVHGLMRVLEDGDPINADIQETSLGD
jgi:hypothetical protein